MITLALDRYDRHLPFFDGTISLPEGLTELKVFQTGQHGALRDGEHRHERMLRDGEFDAAETSLASYIVARSRGLPFTAIPVFPRRLFSQGQIFVNARAGIETPADLAGRTVLMLVHHHDPDSPSPGMEDIPNVIDIAAGASWQAQGECVTI